MVEFEKRAEDVVPTDPSLPTQRDGGAFIDQFRDGSQGGQLADPSEGFSKRNVDGPTLGQLIHFGKTPFERMANAHRIIERAKAGVIFVAYGPEPTITALPKEYMPRYILSKDHSGQLTSDAREVFVKGSSIAAVEVTLNGSRDPVVVSGYETAIGYSEITTLFSESLPQKPDIIYPDMEYAIKARLNNLVVFGKVADADPQLHALLRSDPEYVAEYRRIMVSAALMMGRETYFEMQSVPSGAVIEDSELDVKWELADLAIATVVDRRKKDSVDTRHPKQRIDRRKY